MTGTTRLVGVLLLALLAGVATVVLTVDSSVTAELRARSDDPFAFGNPAFCETDKPVEDFGLSELPPLREAPESGELPFAPKTVSLGFAARSILAVGESVGFNLHSENYFGKTPLHWVLRNRIRPADSSGQTGQVIARGRERVRMISAADEVKLFLEPARRPGFYRYDIEIVDFDGKLLATYGRYLRVEGEFWDARLGLNGDQFHPGEQVLSRVENFGTQWISHGEAFGVQRLEDEEWVSVPGAIRGAWLLWGGIVGPGASGRCSPLSLRRDFPPGQYRIVKEVESASGPNAGRIYFLTAPFEVAG